MGRMGGRWAGAGVLVVLFASWELLARLGWIPTLFFPAPSAVLRALASSVARGEISADLAATLGRAVPGLAIGAFLGLAIGLAMGCSERLHRALDPIVAALHPIPKIAVLPLFMIFLGIGESSKIAVVAVTVFFPMLINTIVGVQEISPLYYDVARNYGATPRKLLTRVILPGSLPMTLSGFRLAANVALIVTIAVEMIAAEQGLGSLVWMSWETMRIELLYAALVILALLGISLNAGLRLLHRRWCPWHPEPHLGS